MEFDKLLIAIDNDGQCPEEELEAVAAFLEEVDIDDCEGAKLDSTYAALTVMGKARADKYQPLLEKFLEFHDALTCSKLLQILCDDWGLTKHYVENLIRFAVGVAWDDDEEVQQTSLRLLGEYLNETSEDPDANQHISSVMDLLLRTFEDPAIDEWTRRAAYLALARAAGKPKEELPGDYAVIDLNPGSKDLEQDVLDYCYKLRAGKVVQFEKSPG